MKRIVLTFGLISAAVSTSIMLISQLFMDKIGFDKAMIVGYTAIVLSFLLVFFGIRSYRDVAGADGITFSKAFKVGILITLVSCVVYVAAWEFVYYVFRPDFCDRYAESMVEKARASGASQEVIEAQVQQMKNMKEMLNNPLIFAAMAFLEPFPVGLVVTLVSAGILRNRKPNKSPQRRRKASI